METAKAGRTDVIPTFFSSIAPHLRESAVLKMLHEEEPSGKVKGSQWPPAGSDVTHKPSSFFTKVSRGQGGRPVEWPPRPNQETENQVLANENQGAPPVPPRPANYPQANMDQVQHQQQTMSQQHHQQQQMSQQQQRQQVTSSSEMRTVKQTYYVQQHQTQEQNYQMHGHQVDGFQQQGLQYQHPQQQQQNVQYQMTQQTSSTAFQGSPQIPAPASNDQIPRQNAAPVFQNAAPAPPQARPAPAPAPAPAPVQNGSPFQYANQNGTDPQHAPAPEGDLSQPDKILPQYQAPPGYCTSYVAVHGEWPPKVNLGSASTNPPPQPIKVDNAPNMTTTYPSGFKLREKAPVEHQPARVVTSQPAFKMTQPIRKGGDSKWPPKGGMEPTQQEVREFIKPRKSNKDYSEFFAKNALPQNYAIYRPPPGTQHHGIEGEEEEGVSNM